MADMTMGETLPHALAPASDTIEIRLSRPQQLFNSLDPSPFHERDLDQDAEDYLVDSADEFPLKKPLTLVIHIPADQLPPGSMPGLPRPSTTTSSTG